MEFGADSSLEDTSDYSYSSSVLSSMRSTEMQILNKAESNQLDQMVKDSSSVPWKDESALLAIYSYLTELRQNLPQVLLAELKQSCFTDQDTQYFIDQLSSFVEDMLSSNPRWERVVSRLFQEVQQCTNHEKMRTFQEFWRNFCVKNYLNVDDGQLTTQKLEGDILSSLAQCYFT